MVRTDISMVFFVVGFRMEHLKYLKTEQLHARWTLQRKGVTTDGVWEKMRDEEGNKEKDG
jgi:hypothetical protein